MGGSGEGSQVRPWEPVEERKGGLACEEEREEAAIPVEPKEIPASSWEWKVADLSWE